MSLSSTLKYSERQAAGQLLQQRIESPASDPSPQKCPILPSSLTFKDLRKAKQLEIDMDLSPYIPIQIEADFAGLEIMGPTGGAWEKVAIDETDASPDPRYSDIHTWEGQVAPGVLIIEEIKRTKGFRMSEVSQAIYEEFFPINTLQYVYLIDVCNTDTRSFVQDEIYTGSNGLAWPDDAIRDWMPGTPEFEALLGTALGHNMAFLILGAFKRGTRRISRIRTFSSFEVLQMQFAIEDIEQTEQTEQTEETEETEAPIQTPAAPSIASTSTAYTGPETRAAVRRRLNLEAQKRKKDDDEDEDEDTGPKKIQKK
ncbi:uncharacterized protein N7479_002222 [Penicillium vulpinum]|uniref:Uncharacterized protein n=1 Tax=Penicillium vulpinum TaxID=29845 RepID=A0A1V6S6U3_9EURO|nr:uncharacterized protein N7479_002222 [Penicillium vulpinum]KAJ5972304.1 hypothetical protein N7479_002222 [Penicillium vulpinum]OQE09767.1 hypothetical protein PENVUL_c005G01943 [Penicillium vulpinum]